MTELPARVHRIDRAGDPEPDLAPAARIVAGSGAARLWNAFSDAAGRFHAGHWQSEPGIRRVRYTETELCVLLEGRVRLVATGGAAAEFGPGDAFVVEGGFDGTWESIGQVTKLYAILDPA